MGHLFRGGLLMAEVRIGSPLPLQAVSAHRVDLPSVVPVRSRRRAVFRQFICEPAINMHRPRTTLDYEKLSRDLKIKLCCLFCRKLKKVLTDFFS